MNLTNFVNIFGFALNFGVGVKDASESFSQNVDQPLSGSRANLLMGDLLYSFKIISFAH